MELESACSGAFSLTIFLLWKLRQLEISLLASARLPRDLGQQHSGDLGMAMTDWELQT